MQKELAAEGVDVSILGVNGAGFISGNDGMCEGRDIPWLQDSETVDAWGLWGVGYRDVYIVDREGARQYRYNLTKYDLHEGANRDLLKDLIREVAAQ